ncbi:MAG: type II toxin-antitoxin system VapC family toxin [Candidatus Thermoplasmatota archaeon]|nr:type II toxin-antitoxin system VapC family toxin [Candidatus Thermoplasmatota archaeon]MCL5789213.1 type II toxin-antitoxin system VapC family toxin [Candidatus Thermoplasmatota archaeon]
MPEVDFSKDILSSIEKKDLQAYTSTLTWDEISYVAEKLLGRSDAIEIGRKFMNFPGLRFIIMDEEVMRRSQMMREKYNLKPRDAIHLSSAIGRNIRKIITDNRDFDNIKEIERIGLKDIDSE